MNVGDYVEYTDSPLRARGTLIERFNREDGEPLVKVQLERSLFGYPLAEQVIASPSCVRVLLRNNGAQA